MSESICIGGIVFIIAQYFHLTYDTQYSLPYSLLDEVSSKIQNNSRKWATNWCGKIRKKKLMKDLFKILNTLSKLEIWVLRESALRESKITNTSSILFYTSKKERKRSIYLLKCGGWAHLGWQLLWLHVHYWIKL